MVDVFALNRVLPAMGIETDDVALIVGRMPGNTLTLFVPPAGWLQPAVEPISAVRFVLVEAGQSDMEAEAAATSLAASVVSHLPLEQRPVLFETIGRLGGKACVSVPDALRPLQTQGGAVGELAKAIQHFADAAANEVLFQWGELGETGRSLHDLGPGPLKTGLTEFMPCIELGTQTLSDDDPDIPQRLQVWRDQIKPVVDTIAAEGGPQIYHFADLGAQFDDDLAHRWMALDCICALLPQADFVRYLVAVAGALSTDALRRALRSPESYDKDFTLYDAFLGPQLEKTLTFRMAEWPIGP